VMRQRANTKQGGKGNEKKDGKTQKTKRQNNKRENSPQCFWIGGIQGLKGRREEKDLRQRKTHVLTPPISCS